jgi:monothiol glutaredoxin
MSFQPLQPLQPANPVTEDAIRDQITGLLREHRVVLFMKGSPEMPRCGFSARTVQALEEVGEPYVGIDVLPDPRIRQVLSGMSNWPTIPQLFVDGELVGGCDIVTQMHAEGELQPLIRKG